MERYEKAAFAFIVTTIIMLLVFFIIWLLMKLGEKGIIIGRPAMLFAAMFRYFYNKEF